MNYRLLKIAATVAAFVIATAHEAFGFTITDTVRESFLVTGMAITAKTPGLFKLKFENNTGGTNLSLCAGTPFDFEAGTCPLQLSGSGGPGFQFLTIADTAQLSGLHIYVINNNPSIVATFRQLSSCAERVCRSAVI
jgi:hypothetical protein